MSRFRHVSRRQFLRTAGAVAGGVAIAGLVSRSSHGAAPAASGPGYTVSLHHDPADRVAASAPAQWALGKLRDVLAARGVQVLMRTDDNGRGYGVGDMSIIASGGAMPRIQRLLDVLGLPKLTAVESLALLPAPAGEPALAAVGNDPQGLVFALTELADRVALATVPGTAAAKSALALPALVAESPANPYRGIVRLFVSETEDKRWFYDREGWEKYFDMLVTHRFNHFNLSFGLSYDFSNNLTDTYTFFIYPFFVDVPGYKVRAIAKGGTPLPADEQKKNLDTLKFISDQAALRGLKFTLGIWTHNYRWNRSPNATYTIDGLNAETQAPYSRDAMKIIIEACPGITGINLRTHGESGVPEGSYDLWKVIMSGITGHKNADGSNRNIELDLHGKTMTQEMIDTAATTGMPLIISCKQWAEHMGLPYVQASIRESEMPKSRDAAGLMALSSGTRSFLRYGIGDLLRQDRNYKVIHRVWPGTQKVLLWGDPLFAAGYGRMGSFAGMEGIDFFEPLSFRGRAGSSLNIPPASDRSGYADAALRTERDWEKYLYTYRLWGRLSYNPEAKPETWRRHLESDFGPAAPAIETALANTSRILPLITTAHDCAAAGDQYWPEVYTNQSLYNTANCPYSEAPVPKVFGNISSLDPQMFATANEYADSLLANKPRAKISPLDVGRQLAEWSGAASRALADADKLDRDRPADKTAALRRAQIDTTIAAGLGQFFALKFRAAVLWQLFNLSGHEPARAAALDQYKQARAAWAALADTAKVYIPHLTFGINPNLHGHWADRLAAIDTEIAGMATRAAQPNGTYRPAAIDALVQAVVNPIRRAEARVARDHKPPAFFEPGQPVPLEIRAAFDSARLLYRHVHQGQRYVPLDMQKQGNTFTAAIPADYTNSPFPIAYYFELGSDSSATMYPGFKENFTGTPYFVVMPAQEAAR